MNKNKKTGWCKIYSSITTHEIFKNDAHFKFFIWLLLHCSFGTHNEIVEGKTIKVLKGEIYITRKKLSEEMNLGLSSIDRYLKALINNYDTLITKENYGKTYKIHITNYEKYQ